MAIRRALIASIVPGLIAMSACGAVARIAPVGQSSPVAASQVPAAAAAELANDSARAAEAPAGATTVRMDAKDQSFFFAPNSITVEHGKVVVFLDNTDTQFIHRMTIQDGSGTVLATSASVIPESKMVFTVHGLEPGTYAFSCTLRSGGAVHASLGMKGTITVI